MGGNALRRAARVHRAAAILYRNAAKTIGDKSNMPAMQNSECISAASLTEVLATSAGLPTKLLLRVSASGQ
jgi:hypothetical protein